ncbi:MAG: hypothetical protein AMS15_06780 [Planctomycetes bacterium DG_23]|nr:MAG: hypothetical protein AMS15_06780 [Planctomycetes bacterium DG_23]
MQEGFSLKVHPEGTLIWFTGIPASGKSSVAVVVEKALRERGLKVENLDADEIRAHLSPELKWSKEDRDLNTKRLAYIGKMLTRNGVFVIVAATSSYRYFRDRARSMVKNFCEVWVKCPLEVCQRRDPKGLYKRAKDGEVNDIAGLHQPYEEPLSPEVTLETDKETTQESAAKVMRKLEELGFIPPAVEAKEPVRAGGEEVYTRRDEAKIKARLRRLGYL